MCNSEEKQETKRKYIIFEKEKIALEGDRHTRLSFSFLSSNMLKDRIRMKQLELKTKMMNT